MLIGYGRVSTEDQHLHHQRGTLSEAGCARIYAEKVSGAARARPELARMLEQLREDDVVVVTRLDRLARSTRDLLEIAERLTGAGVGLRSLAEPWADTTSPAGRMILTIFAGIAEFERSLILERTSSGRRAAAARGVRFGRPRAISDEQWGHVEKQIEEGTLRVPAAATLLKCSRATIYRRMARATGPRPLS